MVVHHGLPTLPGHPSDGSSGKPRASRASPPQIRLRTLLLGIGVLAVWLMTIRNRWIHPLASFPFLYFASVAGGIAAASMIQPTRAWVRLLGGILGSALAITVVIFATFAFETRDATSFVQAFWFSAVMFVPAMVAGGATCLCWEAFLQRHSAFLPRLRKRAGL
jgi:hypothetical protein